MATDTTPTPTRRRTALVVTTVAVALALAAAATYLVVRNRDQATPQPTATATLLTVHGTLRLDIVGPAWTLGAPCTTTNVTDGRGYRDIVAGANVTITDPAGTAIALGQLGVGTVSEHPTIGDPAKTCLFPFQVTGVPAGRGIYGVEIASRGVVRFNEADLGEALELTLN